MRGYPWKGSRAVHISNHYLDLEPVVANLARRFNYRAALIDYDETDETWWLYSSAWMLLTRDERFLEWPGIAKGAYPLGDKKAAAPLWTDDFTSLFQILKWSHCSGQPRTRYASERRLQPAGLSAFSSSLPAEAGVPRT